MIWELVCGIKKTCNNLECTFETLGSMILVIGGSQSQNQGEREQSYRQEKKSGET